MGLLDALDKLSKDGVRVEVAFEQNTILQFLLFGCLAAVIAGTLTALIRKRLSS
ncbi:MAG: hypothetical protein KDD14_19680 [Saprospiraceae bacterium]|nr:hypothetical protein [Saprospiraceae bacterium]